MILMRSILRFAGKSGLAFMAASAIACGGGGGGTDTGPSLTDTPKAENPAADTESDPFNQSNWVNMLPPAGGTWQYRMEGAAPGSLDFPATMDYDSEWDGAPATLFTVGDFSVAGPTGVKFWVDLSDPWVMRMLHIQVFLADFVDDSTKPFQYYEFASPLVVQAPKALDQPVEFTTDGKMVFEDGTEEALTVKGSFEAVAYGEPVDVPYGTVEDCVKVHTTFHVDEGEGGFDIDADIWLREGIGLVRSTDFVGIGGSVDLVAFQPN